VQIPDVPPQLLAALLEAAAGQRLALVGGVVRDLLLHRHHQDPWRGLPDLDLVVEGRAADLVERLPVTLEHHFGTAIPLRQQPHGRYGTVELELQLPQEFGGSWLVDLASARREEYPEPGNNPKVSPGTLEEDLARRDFTVNAMALELRSSDLSGALLLDPHGGREDLCNRRLRFLHDQSVQDDPTRLFRGARYSARLGFVLSEESLDQAHQVLSRWPWNWYFGDPVELTPPALSTRLRMELEILLASDQWQLALSNLKRWKSLRLLDAQLQDTDQWQARLHWARRMPVSMILALVANAKDSVELGKRLHLCGRDQKCLRQLGQLRKLLDTHQWPVSPSQWSYFFESNGLMSSGVALAIIRGDQPRKPLLAWLMRWRHIKSPVTPRDLLQRGWTPGPKLGEELTRLRDLELDKEHKHCSTTRENHEPFC